MRRTQIGGSPTAGMNIAQRILHVGGRNNAAGYVEFGSIQAVEALVIQMFRDLTEQPEQEPVAWMCLDDPERETAFTWKNGHCKNCGKNRIPLYTAPPQREWVGLTDEEIEAFECADVLSVRIIEAKLKEKNSV